MNCNQQQFVASMVMICLLISTSGCTTTQSMEKNTSGVKRAVIYDVPFEKAFELGLYACQILDFKIESQSKTEKYIVAKNGVSAWSWGERIGIYFKEINPNQTEVSVVSKAKLQTNVFAPKWAEDVHHAMQIRLKQLDQAKTTD